MLLSKYLVYVNQGADFDPANYLAVVNVPNGEAELSDVQIENWVDTTTVGTYRVFYSYTNEFGSGTAILTVVVQ